jgi:hypothetical protein
MPVHLHSRVVNGLFGNRILSGKRKNSLASTDGFGFSLGIKKDSGLTRATFITYGVYESIL